MNDDDTVFPTAPDVQNAFDTVKDSAPEEAKQIEEEPDDKTYDEPVPVLKPTPAPGDEMGGIALLSGIQAQVSLKENAEHSEEDDHNLEKQVEGKSKNIDDILNRASVMLNEDWQKATGLDADSTEGYEP